MHREREREREGAREIETDRGAERVRERRGEIPLLLLSIGHTVGSGAPW